jgi:hypothetical protein
MQDHRTGMPSCSSESARPAGSNSLRQSHVSSIEKGEKMIFLRDEKLKKGLLRADRFDRAGPGAFAASCAFLFIHHGGPVIADRYGTGRALINALSTSYAFALVHRCGN